MKQLASIARNHCLFVDDDERLPCIEVVLTVVEPDFCSDVGGIWQKRTQVETIRFAAAPDQIRKLAGSLLEFADQSDALMKPLGLTPNP